MNGSSRFISDDDAISTRSNTNSTEEPVKYDMSRSILKELKSFLTVFLVLAGPMFSQVIPRHIST